MKTSLPLIAAAALALCACESTTPAQRYAQSQQLVAQAYCNRLSPAQQAALATAIYQQAEATRAAQQAQAAAIIAQGFQNAGNAIAEGSRYQPNYVTPTVQMPSNYVRRNAITGQLETVTEHGNGIQSVWPVGQ